VRDPHDRHNPEKVAIDCNHAGWVVDLSPNDNTRTALLMTGNGYAQAETALRLGITEKAAENIMRRHRERTIEREAG